MTAEQTKKIHWLNRAFHAEKRANAYVAKYEREKSLAERVNRILSGTGGGNLSGNSTEDSFVNVADTKEDMKQQLAELSRIRNEITEAIRTVPDDDMQAILIRHFLAYETFDMIADHTHFSRPTVMRKYKEALDNLILNDIE